jgi:hypothetical protein
MASKYDPITKLLQAADARGDRELTVGLDELDALVPGGLPASARTRRGWWSNGGQHASASWMPFGWLVDEVDQSARGWVRFRRVERRPLAAGTAKSAPAGPAAPAKPAANPGSALPEPSTSAEADCTHAALGVRGETDVHVLVAWIDAGPIGLDRAGRLAFPLLPAVPGIYRIELFGAPGQSRSRIHVGETDRLFRWMTGYRSPGPAQSTNLRLNAAITDHLTSGGSARLLVATHALVNVGGPDQPLVTLDLTRKPARGLAESAALVAAYITEDVELANASEWSTRHPAA